MTCNRTCPKSPLSRLITRANYLSTHWSDQNFDRDVVKNILDKYASSFQSFELMAEKQRTSAVQLPLGIQLLLILAKAFYILCHCLAFGCPKSSSLFCVPCVISLIESSTSNCVTDSYVYAQLVASQYVRIPIVMFSGVPWKCMVALSFVFEGFSSENRWEHWNVECEAVPKMSVIFLVHAIPYSLRLVSVWSTSNSFFVWSAEASVSQLE